MSNAKFSDEKCLEAIYKLFLQMQGKSIPKKRKNAHELNLQYVHTFLNSDQPKHDSFRKVLCEELAEMIKDEKEIHYGYLDYATVRILDAFCEDIHSTDVQNHIHDVMKASENFNPSRNFYPRVCFAIAYTNSLSQLSEDEAYIVLQKAEEYMKQVSDSVNYALGTIQRCENLSNMQAQDREMCLENLPLTDRENSGEYNEYDVQAFQCKQFLDAIKKELQTLGISLHEFMDKDKMKAICARNVEQHILSLRDNS